MDLSTSCQNLRNNFAHDLKQTRRQTASTKEGTSSLGNGDFMTANSHFEFLDITLLPLHIIFRVRNFSRLTRRHLSKSIHRFGARASQRMAFAFAIGSANLTIGLLHTAVTLLLFPFVGSDTSVYLRVLTRGPGTRNFAALQHFWRAGAMFR